MKRFLQFFALALGLLVLVLLGNMLRFPSRQVQAAPPGDLTFDEKAAAQKLAQAIRFRTVSHQDPAEMDVAQFDGLHAFLQQAFPLVHKTLKKEVVAGHSLLFTWPGSAPALRPIVLMGHMDVVPVEPGTEGQWQQPPFSGVIEGGFVWGRGSLDDKVGTMSVLQGVELLLSLPTPYRPRHTVYLAFGHDEEVLGSGAKAIAELLRSRGVRPELVSDEGLVISHDMMPGLLRPIALIGTAQKGYLSVELSVAMEGGHSSMPAAHTAAGVLAGAVARVENTPMEAELKGLAGEMFDSVGPEMGLPLRLVMANRWLFGPVVTHILLGTPATAALVRTTTAVTILQSGVKENVLPSSARAVINFRIRPGDTIATVVEHVRRAVADQRVALKVLPGGAEPARPSPTHAPAFAMVQRTLAQVAPGSIVAPGLELGASDARHYAEMSDNIYLFRPVIMGPEDLSRIHGKNERLAIEDFARCIRYHAQLIRNADGL